MSRLVNHDKSPSAGNAQAGTPVHGTTALLEALLTNLKAQHGEGSSVSLSALAAALKSRAYGVILLLMALPCCLPFVYLLPQIVALPMLALCAQLALGRTQVWLPQKLASRQLPVDGLAGTVARAAPWLKRMEFFARPRLTFLTEGVMLRVLGGLLIIPCASILVPLPLTNTVPGIGVAIAAGGLIERDGLLILLGLIMGLIWVAALIIGGEAAISFLIATARGLF
ncbi:MAG: exopolysaccharide biosynthesis protein [Pseudomonadota bacterium]